MFESKDVAFWDGQSLPVIRCISGSTLNAYYWKETFLVVYKVQIINYGMQYYALPWKAKLATCIPPAFWLEVSGICQVSYLPNHYSDPVSEHFNHFQWTEICDKLRRDLAMLTYTNFDVDECWLASSMPQQRFKL